MEKRLSRISREKQTAAKRLIREHPRRGGWVRYDRRAHVLLTQAELLSSTVLNEAIFAFQREKVFFINSICSCQDACRLSSMRFSLSIITVVYRMFACIGHWRRYSDTVMTRKCWVRMKLKYDHSPMMIGRECLIEHEQIVDVVCDYHYGVPRIHRRYLLVVRLRKQAAF